jgi:hypothetical protein
MGTSTYRWNGGAFEAEGLKIDTNVKLESDSLQVYFGRLSHFHLKYTGWFNPETDSNRL